MKKHRKESESGQSLFEALLALAVFIIAIVGVAHIFFGATYSSAYSIEKSQAILLAQEGIEAVRSIRDADFANIEAREDDGILLDNNKWIFQDDPDITDNEFTRKINITSVDDNTWQVESTVTWTTMTGSNDNVSFTEHLTAWRLLTPLPWFCGDDITFTYKEEQVTYGTVESLGECWMDRNLGASRPATAYNDSEAYGDLFQWGRCDDGHQIRTSNTYNTPVGLSECEEGNAWDGDFITNGVFPHDWLDPSDDEPWQGEGGINNPCPPGWRIPTQTEWETEHESWSEQNYNGAYASPLELPAAGSRSFGGSVGGDGMGRYWSSSVSGTYGYSRDLAYSNNYADVSGAPRGYGYSVRCIKD